jgi:aspartyl-tRNA(Asn)/glutamyl-tRNA(Gln) amidotransferase subunit B
MKNLETVIGLEIHVQLKTKSKMFCACDNTGENQPANTTVCPICMGHPGVLPVANEQAIKFGVLAGLALNSTIPAKSKFDRKNYFYPDSPKAYQISQFDEPVAIGGFLEIEIPGAKNNERKTAKIGITRAHLEEDAAKLQHSDDGKSSFVDYNRCGTPLLEIVTEPDFKTPLEAKIFLQELRLIMRYLGVSDADMEKGHLRCDANISLRESGGPFNPKTEIKNLNSFKSVERALEYEIKRQTELAGEGNLPKFQSTRGWNEKKGITEEQRTKEEAHDYRYFPEPDLPPFELSEIKNALNLPELPAAKRKRFVEEYDFSLSDARTLTDDIHLADYTEQVISELRSWLSTLPETEGSEEEIWAKNKNKMAKLVSGWLLSKLGGLMADNKISIRALKITPENFAEFLSLIYTNRLGSSAAMTVLTDMLLNSADPTHVMEDKKLGQMSDSDEIEKVVERVISNNPKQTAEYKSGRVQILQFLVGMVMKETEGRANPKIVSDLLKEKLK